MEEWNEENVRGVFRRIVERARHDPEFRNKCLEHPSEAVVEVSGHTIPNGFKLRMVENSGADLTVVLPDFVGDESLSDADLEAVAGGQDKGNRCGGSRACGVSHPCGHASVDNRCQVSNF